MQKRHNALGLAAVLIVLFGCSPVQHQELSDAEIQSLLADVVAGEQAVEEAGMRYFAELSSDSNNLIPAAALYQRLNQNDSVYVLDIRRAEDYQGGHIPGAVHTWWFDVGAHIESLPVDMPIVVTCYTGQAAGQVIGVLRLMGYEALSLIGGMNNGWLAADLPVQPGD